MLVQCLFFISVFGSCFLFLFCVLLVQDVTMLFVCVCVVSFLF